MVSQELLVGLWLSGLFVGLLAGGIVVFRIAVRHVDNGR